MDADDRRALIRIVRQRLEALERAGIDHLPLPVPRLVWDRPAGSASPPNPAGRPIARPSPPAVAAPPPPPTPTIRPPVATPARPTAPIPTLAPALATSLFDEPELEPAIAEADRPGQLATLAAEVARCTRCPHLAATRTQTVFGEGSPTARLMFIGEAPGEQEDRTGRPFIGPAGALLTDMITKGMGLRRDEVYIANILKSRPPGNRNPEASEMANCLPYLERQIAIVRPEFICLLGKIAASALLETALPLGRLRGKWHHYRSIPTIVTYHPAYLLRNPAGKRESWEDLRILMNAMGLKVPGRKDG